MSANHLLKSMPSHTSLFTGRNRRDLPKISAPQLGSDFRKRLLAAGLSPSPARFGFHDFSYCLRHSHFLFYQQYTIIF